MSSTLPKKKTQNSQVEMPKTLGIWDLTLINIVAMVGMRWIAVAAAAGPSSLGLWVIAMAVFFIPQAFSVAHLSATDPSEGGLYTWTKKAFGNFHGFFCGWCYWVNNLFYFPSLLMFVSANAAIAFWGLERGQQIQDNKLYTTGLTIGILFLIGALNIVGLKVGKWLNNLGAIATWLPVAILVILGFWSWWEQGSQANLSFTNLIPHIRERKEISFFAELCFGFSGFELISFLTAEVKRPQRTIPTSIISSGIMIVLIYMLGTLAILVSLQASHISAVNGIIMATHEVGSRLHLSSLAFFSAFLIALGAVGGTMAWFAGASRVPYVVGVDRYLPRVFTKLHHKFKTPYISIAVQWAFASLFTLFSTFGRGTRADTAYRILVDMCLIIYFIPYIYLFLALVRLPPTSIKGILQSRSSRWITAIFGAGTTCLAISMAILPKDDGSEWASTIKIIGGSIFMFVLGIILYLYYKNKR